MPPAITGRGGPDDAASPSFWHSTPPAITGETAAASAAPASMWPSMMSPSAADPQQQQQPSSPSPHPHQPHLSSSTAGFPQPLGPQQQWGGPGAGSAPSSWGGPGAGSDPSAWGGATGAQEGGNSSDPSFSLPGGYAAGPSQVTLTGGSRNEVYPSGLTVVRPPGRGGGAAAEPASTAGGGCGAISGQQGRRGGDGMCEAGGARSGGKKSVPSSGSVEDVSISERELGLDRGLPWNEHFHIQAGQVRGRGEI